MEGFGPWIQTVVVQKVTCQPWIAEDRDTATHMVKALTEVVGFAHHKTVGKYSVFEIQFTNKPF